MLLDFLCIVLALSTKIIRNKKYCNWIEKITIDRYVSTKNELGTVINEPCEVFSQN